MDEPNSKQIIEDVKVSNEIQQSNDSSNSEQSIKKAKASSISQTNTTKLSWVKFGPNSAHGLVGIVA